MTRCGFAAIVGAPNAGKSTLLNRMTGAKLSIVSPKAQTTRMRVLGILMRGEAQILLVDTPGIFAPKRRLDRAMVAAAWTGAQDADLVMLLVDARAGATPAVREIAGKLAARGGGWLVLNKSDLVAPAKLLPLIAELNAIAPFTETFMVSAVTGEGVDALQDALARAMPEGPHLYPADELTDLPDRLLAAELVREQIFLQTHEEVPYGATVETETWYENRDGSVRVEATIYVARPGHKAILIGERGSRIREIGARARAELMRLLERKVHLFLNVKQRAGWDEEGARLRAIGLEDTGMTGAKLPEGEPAIRTIAMPADTNPSGDIFGGWLMAQMDLAGGTAAVRRAGGRVATVAVDGMAFHRPVKVGDEVSLYARVIGVGRSSIKVFVEAWRRPAQGSSSKVTEATFVFVAIGPDGRPRPVAAEP